MLTTRSARTSRGEPGRCRSRLGDVDGPFTEPRIQ